jgi:hypothetical protein
MSECHQSLDIMSFETTAVEEEIKDRLAQGEVQGRNVKDWKVLDRTKVARLRG